MAVAAATLAPAAADAVVIAAAEHHRFASASTRSVGATRMTSLAGM
jgi:hypothetical protein